MRWNPPKREIFNTLLALSIALTINVVVVLIPPPVSLTRVLFNFHLEIALLLVLFFGTVFNRKGIVWDTISLTLTLILFSVPLIHKWQTAGYQGYLLGGLLPWSDAQDYYSGAYTLMNTGQLTAWAARRPLFGGFLAVLLSITDGHLQAALAMMAVLNGLAVFFASREIQKKHGAFVAVVFLAICYWYYCFHAGVVASEQLGLCFGALGLAFLVRGAGSASIKAAAYGLFLLTIALNARAGAFFVLPALALWLGIDYGKGLGWRKPILIGVAAVIIGMMANLAMLKMIGPPNAAPFSNYSYTLYGLASGDKGWLQVVRDYPDVKEEEVFGLAIQKMKDTPSLFVKGVFHSYREYFTIFRGQFSFLDVVNGGHDRGSQLLWILTWSGLAFAALHRRQGQYGLILATFLGILLSASLAPPIDADAMRIYAATIPCTAYIASTGFTILALPLRQIGFIARTLEDTPGVSTLFLLLPFSAVMLILCFAGPLLVKVLSQPRESNPALSCPPDQQAMTYLATRGSSVYLVADRSVRESYLPSVQLKDFIVGVQSGTGYYPYLMEALSSLKPYYTFSIGHQKAGMNNVDSFQAVYLIANGAILKPGPHQICVTPSRDGNLKGRFFHYQPEADEATRQPPSLFHRNPTLVDGVRKWYALGITLIYIFASLSSFGFWSTPSPKRFLLFGCIVFILAGVLVYLHSNALYVVTWERKSLDMNEAVHAGGYSYKINPGLQRLERILLRKSPVVVYENGVPLKYPDHLAGVIARQGKGRFAIQDNDLIFSSSDNSDPRINGRQYELHWLMPTSAAFQWVNYALAGVGALLLLLHARKLNQRVEAPMGK